MVETQFVCKKARKLLQQFQIASLLIFKLIPTKLDSVVLQSMLLSHNKEYLQLVENARLLIIKILMEMQVQSICIALILVVKFK